MSMSTILRRTVATALVLLMAGSFEQADAQTKTRLTIYTALENDQLQPFKSAIEAAVPEIEVAWVRDSTGVITARFLAEKDNPRADLVIGLAATSIIVFEQAGLLEPYKPAGADALKANFRDTSEPYTWTGI
jgi:iron(III) transport system substrate-binding protein